MCAWVTRRRLLVCDPRGFGVVDITPWALARVTDREVPTGLARGVQLEMLMRTTPRCAFDRERLGRHFGLGEK